MSSNTKIYKNINKSKHKKNKKQNIFNIFDIIFVSVLIVLSVLGFVFEHKINRILNNINLEQVQNITISKGVKVHILNVGQAECIVVELPNQKLLVYDAGLESSKEYIKNYINNITTNNVIDYFILSHTDNDHIGGAEYLLENFDIKNIIRPIIKSVHDNFNETANYNNIENFTKLNNETYANVLSKIYAENCNVYTADHTKLTTLNTALDGEKYNIEFYIPTYIKSSETNDFSTIITITYQGKTIMITGDATVKEERNLLQNYSIPKVDFLVLAHHGSTTSSSIDFLQQVKPEYVYISVGKNNGFDHPNTETLNKLSFLNIRNERIYLTDVCKDIVLAFDGNTTQNYFNNFSIKFIYIYVGLMLVVCVFYLPKFKLFYKKIIVKNLRKRLKIKKENDNKKI